MSDWEENDYEVGYKKPPKSTRFKRGQTGNPNGRPKREKTMRNTIDEVLFTVSSYNVGGKTGKHTPFELMMKRMTQMAANGDKQAMRDLLNVMIKMRLHEYLEDED